MSNKIEIKDLNTYAIKTWCPGCANFSIEMATKLAILELVNEGFSPLEKFVLLSGIGCHAKIVDYINVNSFYSIHGRVIPPAVGVKLAHPELKVVGFEGDGDAYNEGMAHLIAAAKRNNDITLIVHNNRVFALTTGQFTATSPKGFVGGSTPKGSIEEPLNPIELMLASKATFVARGYAARQNHLKELIKKAIKHKGFSFIDVLQPCVSFFNTYEFYNQRVYELENRNHDTSDFKRAMELAREWDYSSDNKRIPIGVFWQVQKPTFEELLSSKGLSSRRKVNIFENMLKRKI
jgi:2-oxoglutarate ferredoxin oxidoreductase subunit beta